MGITQQSLNRMDKHQVLRTGVKMLELGCQNVYANGYHDMAISNVELPKRYGVEMECWDILGCQNAKVVDLREPINESYYNAFDVITDFGTTEHIDGRYYEARKNIHDACKVGGLMIHETPLTGHWIGHGHNYLTTTFYEQLAESMNYTILDLCIEYAMGNTNDGGLVCCVLRKNEDNKFVTKKKFSTFDVRPS
jgi:hypothetical protein